MGKVVWLWYGDVRQEVIMAQRKHPRRVGTATYFRSLQSYLIRNLSHFHGCSTPFDLITSVRPRVGHQLARRRLIRGVPYYNRESLKHNREVVHLPTSSARDCDGESREAAKRVSESTALVLVSILSLTMLNRMRTSLSCSLSFYAL